MRLRDLRPAGADEPCEAQHLAGAERERDVVEPAGLDRPLDAQHARAPGARVDVRAAT